MRVFLLAAAVAGAVTVFGQPIMAGVSRPQAPGTESFSRTVPISPTGSFTLSNPSGDISIIGGGDVVRIEAVKHAGGDSGQDARAQLAAIGIEVTASRGSVVVRTTIPERSGTPGSVDYTITVPATVAVTVKTFFGDLRISNVRGAVEAATVSGSLVASALGDLRTATTISGDLEIRDAQGDHVSAGTLSGAVRVNGLTVSSIDLDVGDGSVSCADVRAGRAYLRTDRGDIEYAGPLSRGGLYQAQSRSGSVRFTPQGDTGFRLDASSFRGRVDSRYPFPESEITTGEGGVIRAIQGAVGDAGASVTLRSLSGNVTLSRP